MDGVIDFKPKKEAEEATAGGYPALIPVAQATELFDCSPQSIRKMINSGEVPGCRFGRRLYVKRDELFKSIKEGKHNA